MSVIEMVPEYRYEIKVDPNKFEGEWLAHKPANEAEEAALKAFKKAKKKGELPVFACMTVDPSVEDGKLVYEKGMQPAIGFSYRDWKRMLREFDPSRTSRMMSRSEYMYRNMFIVQLLSEAGWKVEDCWKAVFQNSEKIGNFRYSLEKDACMQPTGSCEVVGFCDLGNTRKLLCRDPYCRRHRTSTENMSFYIGGGSYCNLAGLHPVGKVQEFADISAKLLMAVGEIALDP